MDRILRLSLLLLALSTFLTPLLAITGPHPSDVAPTSFASDEYKNVPIPTIRPSCQRRKTPVVGAPKVDLSVDYRKEFQNRRLSVDFKLCSGYEENVRMRLLQLQGGGARRRTRVLHATSRRSSSYFRSFDLECASPRRVYVEVCVRLTANATRPFCGMSKVFRFQSYVAPEPRLAHRPPIKLELAPGDSARVVTRLGQVARVRYFYPDAIGNGGYDFGIKRFFLRSVAEARNGRRLKMTPLREQNRTVLRLASKDTAKRGGRYLNKAKVYTEFSEVACLRGIDTHYGRHDTEIIVSPTVKSLVKQDVRLPLLEQPVFPIIRSGDSVNITVNATNTGGGMREGGAPTELHYQWYLRDTVFIPFRSYAEPIDGATSATLTLDQVLCRAPEDTTCCGTYGYKIYFVDVCNTFGCHRSEAIFPRYRSKTGDIISDETCDLSFVDKEEYQYDS